MSRVLLVVLAVCLFGSASAKACSIGRDYFVPLNFDLVRLADSIVLARPAEASYSAQEPFQHRRRFDVIETLAGEAAPDQVELLVMWGAEAPERVVRRSDHASLGSVHPDVHSGPCDRVSFPDDATFVFFLQNDGDWQVADFPMARTREDVPGRESLWVWAIGHYAQIAALETDAQQYEALIAMREAPPPGPREWQGELVRDISRYLVEVTPRKSIEFLEAQLGSDEANSAERAAALYSVLAVDRTHAEAHFLPISDGYQPLPLVGPLFEFHMSEGNQDAAWSLLRPRLDELLTRGSVRDRSVVGGAIRASLETIPLDVLVEAYWAFRRRNGLLGDFQEMRSRLEQHMDRTPRDFPALAIMQAAYGLPGVVEWAESALQGGSTEDAMLALSIIAEASAGAGWQAAKEITCGPSFEGRAYFIRALGESRSVYALDWLLAISARNDLSDWERADLHAAILALSLRTGDTSRYFEASYAQQGWSNRSDEAWLVFRALEDGSDLPAPRDSMVCNSED